MPLREYAVVHYHEIGLKGGNRSFFERALIRNIDLVLSPLGAGPAKRLPGRVIVPLPLDADAGVFADRLKDVFGIANYSFAAGDRAMTLERVCDVALARAGAESFETFAVRARKAHSDGALSTREMNEKIGAFLLERTGSRVDLSHPDLTVYVEIVGDLTLVYAGRRGGPGGLPVGVSGTSLVLLSPGIDSPVAAARMMRRGSRCIFAHFHSMPFTDGSSVRQVEELVQILTRFQPSAKLWLLPLASAQQAIVAACPNELRTILYRRMMMRIGTELALREGAKALVTGDSLGQVASQTMENLTAVEDAAGLPVLRPHVGRDKLELITEAQALGTFETSSAPCQEACVLFEPKRPVTKASVAQVRAAEEPLDLDALVAECLDAAELRRVTFGS